MQCVAHVTGSSLGSTHPCTQCEELSVVSESKVLGLGWMVGVTRMIDRAHVVLVGSWVMLGEKVCLVGGTFVPVDAKHVLVFTVLYPEVSHVHGRGALGLDCSSSNACSSSVVSLNGGRTMEGEEVAAGFIRFHHIRGEINPADILSKHWAYQAVWPQLQPLMFFAGDVGKLLTPQYFKTR